MNGLSQDGAPPPAAIGVDEDTGATTLVHPAGRFDAVSRRQTLGDMLARTARRYPDKGAIMCGGQSWTYAELDMLVDDLAAGLQASGVRLGDRVALMSRNSHWFVALRFAVARAGGVLVPINFMLTVDDVAYILDHSGAGFLFTDAACAATALAAADRVGLAIRYGIPGETHDGRIDGTRDFQGLRGRGGVALPAIHAGSIVQIIYTSGTESRPKGAMLSHEAVMWQYQSCIADCGWSPDAVVLNVLPLFHCAQLDAFLGPSLHVGASNIIAASPAPDIVLPLIAAHGVTSFFAPPTVWIALLRSPLFDPAKLTSLTHGYYGASIMPVEVLRELRQRLPGLRLWNCYGQTEIAPVAAVLQPQDQERKAGAAGRPTLHVETRIVDDGMRDVQRGQVGEIVHRSPQLMTAYWRDPQRTEEAFAGGWFHSGDLGIMDEEGYITVVDRKKDMIKTGGENVASREVEEAIYLHPAVSEVAVVGTPHPRWIEAVTAFIVPKAGAAVTEADILAHCAAHLAGFKAPKRVVFVENLPRNASGKILKRDLRQLA
ncbi:acyl-CoA synthetase [Niveispirillum sp. KHB5.9]|uniref:acyl-CoA synthetase n=1 Tax=Niveispirillum sp. KHB5.9 TaxID=3400269 RepID=UPI003A86862F